MDVKEIGEKLVALCREGKHLEAVDTLYSRDITSVEARASETMPAQAQGLQAVREKNVEWLENHDVHSMSAEGPMVNAQRFAVIYDFEFTSKQSGERGRLREVALYSVEGEKIVREEFFY